MLMQGETAAHDPPTGPADVDVLQFPNTASSGRRLIRTTFGASYFFSLGGTVGSFLIRSLCSLPQRKDCAPHPLQAPPGAGLRLSRIGKSIGGLVHSPTSISFEMILWADSITAE